jgi:hypothetical protein
VFDDRPGRLPGEGVKNGKAKKNNRDILHMAICDQM